MTSNRQIAISLFSYQTPGYQATVWLEDRLVDPPESAAIILPERELFRAPVPWARFETPVMSVAYIDNYDTWLSTAQWSDNTGTIINVDPPTWQTKTSEFRQLAAQMQVDSSIDTAETDYNVFDAAVRSLSEIMISAVYQQLLTKTPDANGPATAYSIASGESKIVDANSQPLSFQMLMCLRQQLNVQVGLPEQYSIVLAPDVYAQFVSLMTASGNNHQDMDPVTGRKEWHFDRVRVVESEYVDSANGCILKSDMAALPTELREKTTPSVARGLMIGSTHAPGVVLSNVEDLEGQDITVATLQVTAGWCNSGSAVGWLENVGV